MIGLWVFKVIKYHNNIVDKETNKQFMGNHIEQLLLHVSKFRVTKLIILFNSLSTMYVCQSS